MLNSNNREIESKIENENQVIEIPKNYNDIVNFKLKRLEKEYEETIKKNFNQADLENNEEFNSDSEVENDNRENNNNYYQCLDGEEFVDVYEDQEENKNEESNGNNINNNFLPENFITNIDEKKFEEFVKVSDKILVENKHYLENLNKKNEYSKEIEIKKENIFDNININKIKSFEDEKEINNNKENIEQIEHEFEFVNEKSNLNSNFYFIFF